MHEAQLHEKTSFITLTYNNESLPKAPATSSQSLTVAGDRRPGSRQPVDRRAQTETPAHENQEWYTLAKSDLQLFTKRLNEDVRRRSSKGVKYYACGEYGDRTSRPHYHIAVYGEDFSDDRQPWCKAQSGLQLWRSSRLKRLWPHGDADIGDLTFESAAYIARYITKKITGTKALDHYNRVDREGNMYRLEPEFSVMSRRPGIASEWFKTFKDDVYPHDHVISRGHPAKPPRYYDKLLEQIDPSLLEHLKADRTAAAELNAGDNTPARLEARETVAHAKLNQQKRSLE